jgi:thiol-disulfide isomerase/thioredoxin
MKIGWWCSALFVFTLLISSVKCAEARPPVFSNYSFKTAFEQAGQENKIVVCDFTASWCGPCHMMDKITWSDPKVVEWLTSNAIALQIDVDRDPKIAQTLRVEAMPTIVVFQPNQTKEFDRKVGLRLPQEFLPWLEATKGGIKVTDMLKQKFFKAISDNDLPAEVNARMQLGDALLESKQYAEATEQFDWLWTNYENDNTAFADASHGKVAPSIGELTTVYKPARLRFAKLRDESENKSRGDWIILNEVLGDQQRTLDWFDHAKDDPSQQGEILKQRHKLETLFEEKNRWKEISMVTPTPLEDLDQLSAGLSQLKPAITERFDPLAEKTAILYAAFLQDGKEELANKIARKGLAEENTSRMRERLVAVAWAAFQPRLIQLVWLWEAKTMLIPPWAPMVVALSIIIGAIILIFKLVEKKLAKKS